MELVVNNLKLFGFCGRSKRVDNSIWSCGNIIICSNHNFIHKSICYFINIIRWYFIKVRNFNLVQFMPVTYPICIIKIKFWCRGNGNRVRVDLCMNWKVIRGKPGDMWIANLLNEVLQKKIYFCKVSLKIAGLLM